MYNPPHFRVDDISRIVELIRSQNFALIISSGTEGLNASSVPVMVNDGCTAITGHIARANPFWKNLDDREVLVVFQGPNHYISPPWYGEETAVPTWNYAVVHVRGIFHAISDDDTAMGIIDQLVDFHESKIGQEWKADWSRESYRKRLQGLVAFEIRVDSVEAKWKLSQDHPRESRVNVATMLRKIDTENSRKIAEWMESS